jgi:hypothetical protein
MYHERVTASTDITHSAGAADQRIDAADAELQAVVTSWRTLPLVVKSGILAMIRAATHCAARAEKIEDRQHHSLENEWARKGQRTEG